MSDFKTEYNVTMPKERSTARSKEYFQIMDFLKSGNETMRFVYKTDGEARLRRQSLSVTIKRENIPVKAVVSGNELYIRKTRSAND